MPRPSACCKRSGWVRSSPNPASRSIISGSECKPTRPVAAAGRRGDPANLLGFGAGRSARAAGVTFLSETRAVLGEDFGTAREVRITNAEEEQTVSGRAVVIATGLGNAALGKGLEFVTRVVPGSRLGAGCVIQHDDCEAYPKGRISMAVGRFGYVGVTRTIEGLVVASCSTRTF